MYYRQVLKFGKSPNWENKKRGSIHCPAVRDDPGLRDVPGVRDVGRSTAPRTKHGMPGEQIQVNAEHLGKARS